MKILVVGGGPGGLYASVLLKKNNPGHDIKVIERNPAGVTYGWGVVFSSLTLTGFREADYTTYQQISDQFVIWDPIDVHYRGEVIRCGGHTFAGMSRRALLNLLAARCVELGVQIETDRELTDFSSFKDYDLVIGADGVNSLIRKAYADVFKPRLTPGKARYIWYGTNQVFDAFTFVIRENEHGLFQAHAYSFDGETSTFIVECDEQSWRNASLDQASEAESIAYCEKLFEAALHGHKLLSNRSAWISFVEVKNRKWSHGNIVLLGDAVHTAHFSIGSGTRLAMDDAIALAHAFEVYGQDVQAALHSYELERKPRVDIIQQAARESQGYFETIKCYRHLEPVQFAFHLLTRSGRLSYDNLKQRDPFFVERVDRWFSAQNLTPNPSPLHGEGSFATSTPPLYEVERGKGGEVLVAPPPYYTSLDVRETHIANRVVLTPAPTYSAQDGLPDTFYAQALATCMRSGAGVVLTSPVAVSAEGRITPGDAGLYSESHQGVWAELIARIKHTSASRIMLQLSHAGRRGATQIRTRGLDRPLRGNNWRLLAPSALQYTTRSATPKAMIRTDMDAVRDDFVRAAQMAERAGVDMLMLNFAHGYLLGSFLSPLTNQRTDEYGGTLENRVRFPLEVFTAVRTAWPSGKPVAVVLTADDWADGGLEIEDAVTVAAQLKAARCDLILPVAGQTIPNDSPDYTPNALVSYCERIRSTVHILTMAAGNIVTTNQFNSILAAGSADLCLALPHPPNIHAKEAASGLRFLI